jgi:predicted nucleic acid-binding protein
MPEQAIVDTSVLIALERINTLEILCKIYSQVILPEAVINEFGPPPIECYSAEKVKSPLVRLLVLDLNLGRGEAESIALASEMGLRLALDDLKARKVAEKLGLRITGTIGVLLKAESLALIGNAYDKVEDLRDKGFYISDQLLDDLSKYRKQGLARRT